jgi:hypothetical protein
MSFKLKVIHTGRKNIPIKTGMNKETPIKYVVLLSNLRLIAPHIGNPSIEND